MKEVAIPQLKRYIFCYPKAPRWLRGAFMRRARSPDPRSAVAQYLTKNKWATTGSDFNQSPNHFIGCAPNRFAGQ